MNGRRQYSSRRPPARGGSGRLEPGEDFIHRVLWHADGPPYRRGARELAWVGQTADGYGGQAETAGSFVDGNGTNTQGFLLGKRDWSFSRWGTAGKVGGISPRRGQKSFRPGAAQPTSEPHFQLRGNGGETYRELSKAVRRSAGKRSKDFVGRRKEQRRL